MMNTKRKLESERGSVLILTALCMVVLLGFVGMALDTGYLYHERRLTQTAADAGAMSGASEIRRERTDLLTASALAGTADNGFADGVDGVEVNVYNPPITGFYVDNDAYVEVTVSQPRSTYFMSLFGWDTVDIPARAVAGYSADDQICIYALEDADPDAFWYNSSATITAACGLQVNSCDDEALHETSNAIVNVGSAAMCGDVYLESSSVLNLPDDEEPQTGVTPATDPLIDVPEPVPPLTCTARPGGGGTTWDWASGSRTHSGGGTLCGGIHLQNASQLTLNNGIYYIMGGGIDLEGDSRLSGDGVMFYLTQGMGYSYGPVGIESNARMDLSAPSGGTLAGGVYDGILFFQNRNLPSSLDNTEHRFQSSNINTIQSLEGAMYFQDQVLRFESSTHIELVATGSEGAIVARRIIGDSNSIVNVTADPDAPSSALQRLTLVE